MIVINDVMAYMFGFFFGRTPLIKLSPKKTWEGFIGGGISTVFLGLLVIRKQSLYFFIIPVIKIFTRKVSIKILLFYRCPMLCANIAISFVLSSIVKL